MVLNLVEIIFGIENWLCFVCNKFECFEVCVGLVKINEVVLFWFVGMVGFYMLIVVFYGEG